jgi:hypothetical protein
MKIDDIASRIAAVREHFSKSSSDLSRQENIEDAGVFVNFNNWPQDFHNWSQFMDFSDA